MEGRKGGNEGKREEEGKANVGIKVMGFTLSQSLKRNL